MLSSGEKDPQNFTLAKGALGADASLGKRMANSEDSLGIIVVSFLVSVATN